MILRNNPTASIGLVSDFTKSNVSPVKPRHNDLDDHDILCASCTVFDSERKAVKRELLWHDIRNERFVCRNCNKTYSERQIRHVLRLDLPEYTYYDENSNKDIQEIDKEREKNEKWVVRPINSESPEVKSKKKAAKVIK